MKPTHIRDYGITIGHMPPGERNKISDVPGVTVGHCTIADERHNTGVTVILPAQDNLFADKMTAAVHVINGFGKTCGTVQVDELGYIETPIALTNTLGVGKTADALVGWTLEQCRKDGVPCFSVNPVVGETNDAGLNDIADRIIGETEVRAAIGAACADFEEGSVGAGRGTSCFGLKGGIGSSSRVLTLDGRTYTVGVLVQSNFGRTADLMIAGRPVGERIAAKIREEQAQSDKGSIMIVLGTDVPLTEMQLGRVLRRAAVGLARTGSYIGHGSGDVAIGFTTANRHRASDGSFRNMSALNNRHMDAIFRAAAESVEESVLNSLTTASPIQNRRSLTEFLPGCLEE